MEAHTPENTSAPSQAEQFDESSTSDDDVEVEVGLYSGSLDEATGSDEATSTESGHLTQGFGGHPLSVAVNLRPGQFLLVLVNTTSRVAYISSGAARATLQPYHYGSISVVGKLHRFMACFVC